MKTPAGLFWCLLFRRRFVDGARFEAEEVLADGDRVLLICEELGDATSGSVGPENSGVMWFGGRLRS